MIVDSVSSPLPDRQKRLTQLIEQLLKEGWTQSSLAETVGVDFSTVHRWLKGKTIPDPDSKNFRRLAQISGGNVKALQFYIDGEISLSAYRQSLESQERVETNSSKNSNSEQIKTEILAKIKALDPSDIAEVISSSVAFLANQV